MFELARSVRQVSDRPDFAGRRYGRAGYRLHSYQTHY